MFISKKHIPRRTFLTGAGTILSLPLLEAMLPAQTPLSQTAANPNAIRRFVGVWHPMGAGPGYWSPTQAGSDFEFSFITKPLEPFRNRTVLVSNLDAREAFSTEEEPGGNHARGAVFLSGARPRRTNVNPYLGVTIDQMIAAKYGKDTILPSIQYNVETANTHGGCNWGYSCAYTNNMSWITPTQPLPPEVNPRIAFERLFGDGADTSERIARRQRNASILDSVNREIPGFKKKLGPDDQKMMDDYLDNIREIERRIEIALTRKLDEPTAEIPFGTPQDNHVHFQLMYDLLALAFQGDITRSATYMLGHDISAHTFPRSGFDGPWHGSSHHGDKPANIANYALMNRYHVQNLAYFATKLQSLKEGDGTILDHVLIYKGSNMGNSHRHAHEKVPVILLGGINGAFKGNRHIAFPDNVERTSNLLLGILHLYDINVDSIGGSTGPLPGLAG